MNPGTFQSGQWTGFYTYAGSVRRHRMDLLLEFEGGRIDGEGVDDVGAFIVTGRFDASSKECTWRKEYLGMHSVFYEGRGDTRGIRGTWSITVENGGFHIRPLPEGGGAGNAEVQEEPIEDGWLEPVLS